MPGQKPIECTFSISEVDRITEREAHTKRYYGPVYTMHKWWARRLGSVFHTIALYTLTDEEPGATAKPAMAQQEVVAKPPASTARWLFVAKRTEMWYTCLAAK